ncbi:MAG: hypothetical protein D6E12_14945, partial [Desulfovibrio sp.]
MKHSKYLNIAVCLILVLVAGTGTVQAQDTMIFRADQHPETGETKLHGTLEPGTHVQLLGYGGSCQGVVSSTYSQEMVNHLAQFSAVDLGEGCDGIGNIFAGVNNAAMSYEPVTLQESVAGFDAAAHFDAAREAAAQVVDFSSYDFASAEPVALASLSQDGVNVDLVMYHVDDANGGTSFYDSQILVAFSNGTAQAFLYGCWDYLKQGVFLLDGDLYIASEWRCCACGGDAYTIS